MIIKNGTVFVDGKLENVDVKVNNGVIEEVGQNLVDDEIYDATDKLVFPGFIDTHIHGCLKNFCGETVESLKDICDYLPRFGVTSFMPTPIEDATDKPVREYSKNIKACIGSKGADIIGAFVYSWYRNRPSLKNYPKAKPISKELSLDISGGDFNDIKAFLIAPELEGGLDHITWLKENGVMPVIGFSEGSPEVLSEAVKRGARLTDHFPNGFPQIDHHFDQAVVQCLLEDDLYMQLNGDCIHVAPAFIKLILKAKGDDKILAVSDSSPLLGMPEGEYELLKQRVFLKDGAVRDINGKLVTGAHSYDENLRTLYKHGFSLETIGKISSTNAARLFGLSDRGRISKGLRGDIVVLDKELNVVKTMIKGSWYF